MSVRRLLEEDVNLVKDHLKSTLPTVLAALRVQRADAKVSTEPPAEYLTFEKAQGYRTPCVFILGETMDFRQQAMGANHVNASSTVNVTVVLEERNADLLQIKSYRYMAALHECLEQANLESSDNLVKIQVRVARAENSPLYSNAKDEQSATAVFRKEVTMVCEIEHYENY